jgi:hypothetical protein
MNDGKHESDETPGMERPLSDYARQRVLSEVPSLTAEILRCGDRGQHRLAVLRPPAGGQARGFRNRARIGALCRDHGRKLPQRYRTMIRITG